MFAKLFSRITESSLMEEDIPVRYTFVLLLAICDPTGLVVGTDVAIARRLNMPLEEFVRCVQILGEPDVHSNSKELDGRRVIRSEGERGFQVVNYEKYRDLKTEEERRSYMRDYMRKYRSEPCKLGKTNKITVSTSESTSASGLEECEKPLTEAEQIYEIYPRKVARHAALKKIEAAIKEFGFEEVKQSTQIFADAWKGAENLTFCPHPSTWFGQKRFNDEPSTWVRTEPVTPRANGSASPVDSFWKDKARMDMLESEIKAIESRASHTALDMIVEPRDLDRYIRLKNERKELKAKMNL